MVIAKLYDPVYLHDEYESVDPLRLAARSVPNEVKAYEMLQSLQGICIPRCLGLYATAIREQGGRTVYVLLLELVAGKELRYLSEDVEKEAIVADYIYHVLPDDDRLDRPWCPGQFGPKEHSSDPQLVQGPFRLDERCWAQLEFNADNVGAVMLNSERIHIEYSPNSKVVSWLRMP